MKRTERQGVNLCRQTTVWMRQEEEDNDEWIKVSPPIPPPPRCTMHHAQGIKGKRVKKRESDLTRATQDITGWERKSIYLFVKHNTRTEKRELFLSYGRIRELISTLVHDGVMSECGMKERESEWDECHFR